MAAFIMGGIFAVSSIAGIIRSGVDAQNQQNEVNAAAAQLQQQTLAYATAAQQTVATCEFDVTAENMKIEGLWEDMTAANARLQIAKQDFTHQFNVMSITVIVIIIAVFFLLLLKKFNLLTLNPLGG